MDTEKSDRLIGLFRRDYMRVLMAMTRQIEEGLRAEIKSFRAAGIQIDENLVIRDLFNLQEFCDKASQLGRTMAQEFKRGMEEFTPDEQSYSIYMMIAAADELGRETLAQITQALQDQSATEER